jgi:predicted naringenin-chalcone synthase
VCVELCSLHFYPSCEDEEIVANLLFSDGAAAVIMCGEENSHVKNKTVLKIDKLGSACIPNTAELMTWNISSSAFRMFLSKEIVPAIKNNISSGLGNFIDDKAEIDHWAIHPGGVKIVEAVQHGLGLGLDDVAESLHVLENYGNMSSPTILFILKNIFEKIKSSDNSSQQKIFSCAFGPGVNIEMISMSSVNTSPSSQSLLTEPQNANQI